MKFLGIYFIIEIVLLVVAGHFLGVGLTLFIILATSIIGVLVLRLAGLSTLMTMRQKMVQGGTITNEDMNRGLLLGIGGILLFLPGLLGNVIGTLLVIPVTGTFLAIWVKKLLAKLNVNSKSVSSYHYEEYSKSDKPDAIEGEWQRKDDN